MSIQCLSVCQSIVARKDTYLKFTSHVFIYPINKKVVLKYLKVFFMKNGLIKFGDESIRRESKVIENNKFKLK